MEVKINYISKHFNHQQILNQIGFMPQQDGLYNELSVYDNLRFFAGIQGIHLLLADIYWAMEFCPRFKVLL